MKLVITRSFDGMTFWESLREILDERVIVKRDLNVATKTFQTDIIHIKNATRILPHITKASNDQNTNLKEWKKI